jgi:transposase InsO family protein
LKIPRKTISRWLNRRLQGQPARFKRTAKIVWNKTVQPVLDKIKKLLEQGHSDVIVWIKIGKTCLRTVQRYKKQWFPPQPTPKVKVKRYERRKVYSLMHTDWGVKRIKHGVRCCFSFYEDDSSRKLFSLRAYQKASLFNTLHNFHLAVKKTGGFKAVLTDCGGMYRKNFDAQMNGVKHIRTRPYNPKCNGKAENIVKKVKRFLNRFEVQDLKHANQLFKQFQKEYNNTPHSSLKYRSPNQVYSDKKKNGAICAVT